MEQFYSVDIRSLPDPAADLRAMDGLPRERQERCLRYKRPQDRRRCLGAGRLIQQILAEHAASSCVTLGAHGKPEAQGVYFSIAHSGEYVIGVAADSPVGCDVERIKPPPMAVAERCFTPAERAYMAAHRDAAHAFWQLWTLKESYVKMTGEGMSAGLRHVEIGLGETLSVYRGGVRQPCVLRHLCRDGYAVALCTQGPLV